MTVFSKRFCKRRKELNLTQQEIAEKLNVGYRTVSHWENGAYPDGELLPKIANVLGVSLDYLFGRNSHEDSIEQEVLTHFQKEIDVDSEDFSKLLLPKIFDILWAIQISWQKGNITYWKDEEINYKKASAFFLDNGFSFFQHKSDAKFYCICEKPKNGFGSILENANKISEFLKFLSEPENQKILLSLFSLRSSEYISIPVFSTQTRINENKIQKTLEFLESIKDDYGNSIINKINYTNKNGNKDILYKILIDKCFLFLMIFILANELLEPTSLFDNSVFLNNSSIV